MLAAGDVLTGSRPSPPRELDWVIKREWIESYMTRNRLSWRDPKISLMDLQYHDIRPDRGLYYRLVARDMVDRITDDETIEAAKHTPPQTTRARLRGEFIRQANLKGKDYRVDWVISAHDHTRDHLSGPFQAHDERVLAYRCSDSEGGSRPPRLLLLRCSKPSAGLGLLDVVFAFACCDESGLASIGDRLRQLSSRGRSGCPPVVLFHNSPFVCAELRTSRSPLDWPARSGSERACSSLLNNFCSGGTARAS